MARTILFADDDPLIRQLYQSHIERAGYSWVGAVNGREAIAVAEREKPSLAIIDILMPEMDGLEVLQEFEKAQMGIPVILISAEQTYYAHRCHLRGFGASLFLTKPFGPQQLLDAIRRLLRNAAAVP